MQVGECQSCNSRWKLDDCVVGAANYKSAGCEELTLTPSVPVLKHPTFSECSHTVIRMHVTMSYSNQTRTVVQHSNILPNIGLTNKHREDKLEQEKPASVSPSVTTHTL